MNFLKKDISSYLANIAIVLLFCSGLFFVRCANTMAPTGGPRDTLPPVVVYSEPEFGKLNFAEDQVLIEFDEYVVLKDQQKEFYTSPLMKYKPILTIRGRGIVIEIKDTLKENTTYSLNFGNSIADNNEGNPLNDFRYVFSTGNEIDSLVISGMTVNAESKDSLSHSFIYLFSAEMDTIPAYDSLMFLASPSVVGRAAKNGKFFVENLKPIDYKAYALQDNNGNNKYEPGVDLIGFLDSVVNPLKLPNFNIVFDTIRKYLVPEPQLYFRMFMEQQQRRQNLTSTKRPEQHRLEFMFGAANPIINEIVFDSVASSDIITEYVTEGRDTMNLWLNVDSELLPDTIKGHIIYMKQDSVGVLKPDTMELSLDWRFIESKEAERERKKKAEEIEEMIEKGEVPPVEPSPFGFKVVEGGTELNPLRHIEMKFDAPLTKLDSTKIKLFRLGEEDKKYVVNFGWEQDSVDIRTWRMKAQWADAQKYSLMIPSGTIMDVKGHVNDTLKSEFTVYDPDKFSTLILDLKGGDTTKYYVIDLLSESGNTIIQQKKFARLGAHTFRYVEPGYVRVRIVEDMNVNGKWDSGDLTKRIQPEKVEVHMESNGDEEILTKENWEIEVDIDVAHLFAPKTLERLKIDTRLREASMMRKQAKEAKTVRPINPTTPQEEEYNPAFDAASGVDRPGIIDRY